MQPGSNFVLAGDEATWLAERTIAVLSPAFMASPDCRAEWAAAFAKDPTGGSRRLVPVRCGSLSPAGCWARSSTLTWSASRGRGARRAAYRRQGRTREAGGRPWISGDSGGDPVRRPEQGAAIFNVPVMTRTFVGRARALEQLAAVLSSEGVVAITQVHAIHGLGGVGKTQLAARYARRHRDTCDVIWWLRAEQVSTLRPDVAALAVALGLVDVNAGEHDAVAAAVDWLERNSRWLLVFDNATAPTVIARGCPRVRAAMC